MKLEAEYRSVFQVVRTGLVVFVIWWQNRAVDIIFVDHKDA